MELSDFLLARIAEDEEAVRAWSRGVLDPDASNIEKRWQPARVLAECEAKRRIIHDFAPPDPHAPSESCEDCNVLYALALPYADHPDYREEWKP